jgi:aspartate kinase
VAKEINAEKVTSNSKIAKVSVVGVGMRSHAGVASQMFAALAELGINILMITTSEIKISVIIEEKFLELAVRALHSSFGLEKEPKDENAD